MTNPTNRDLEIRMIRMEGTINNVLEKMVDFKDNQKVHEAEDARQFDSMHVKINGINRYYAAVGTVAGFIGSAIGFAIEYFIDRKS